ncbi:hypothetical protein LLH03_15405 [bacterium]|nr:hypothetical protein [bacterium]
MHKSLLAAVLVVVFLAAVLTLVGCPKPSADNNNVTVEEPSPADAGAEATAPVATENMTAEPAMNVEAAPSAVENM